MQLLSIYETAKLARAAETSCIWRQVISRSLHQWNQSHATRPIVILLRPTQYDHTQYRFKSKFKLTYSKYALNKKMPTLTIVFIAILGFGFCLGQTTPYNVGGVSGADAPPMLPDSQSERWKKFSIFPRKSAKSPEVASHDVNDVTEAASGDAGGGEADKKKRVGFKDKRIIEYENRLRNFSTPDKIFRYFATLKVGGEHPGIYMTPDDFVRSITPGMKQPEGLGLDNFKRFDPKKDSWKENLECGLREDSIFYKLGQNGLISFSDYMFLLVVLSTPPRMFEIAFKMFDLNGDGDVEFMEFEKVRNIAQGRTAVGRRHRDHANTGSTIKPRTSALNHYFFGENLDQRLTVERFLTFQKQLHQDVLWLEFNRFADEEGMISERNFAASLLDYAEINDKRKIKMLRRVRKAFKAEDPESKFEAKGISFPEFLDFSEVLKHITDIDTALMFYHLAGASIDKATLKHVAKTVAKVTLSDHVVDVVFVLFDENDDNELSNKEFVSVMKRRIMRGLDKPKDTGITRLCSALWKCAKNQTMSWVTDS